MNTNNGSPDWYNSLLSSATHNFNSVDPQITFSGSGFQGLDGSYYATVDGDNFALVSTTGAHTVYFSNSATPPDCDTTVPNDPTNTAPVASLTATPSEGITPLEVTFDASGSTDADDDVLTYNIDYGDGTSGTGITSTHTYTTGEYIATLTVNDGQGGTDTASVNITVNDDVIVVDPPNGDCTFGAPTSGPLATINGSFENIYVLGTGGPNVDNIYVFSINWDQANNGLYQFSFNTNSDPWFIDLSTSAQNFNQANPEISLVDTGIPGLDGNYYAVIDAGNFALVGSDFTIYFSNSATAPNCESLRGKIENSFVADRTVLEKPSFKMYPNPATSSVSLRNSIDLKDKVITIFDLSGKQIKSLAVTKSTTHKTIDISGIESGLYLVRIFDPSSGYSSSLKLIVE